MEKAVIMEIQRFSIHDGPGIRTTVFFKGCHMRCQWCHNPESQSGEPELLFYKEKCIGCGACAPFCKKNAHVWQKDGHDVDLKRCRGCAQMERCAESCPAGALRLCGCLMDTGEVFAEILKDRNFYGTEGGVTFSGGEALLQTAFLGEILPMCRAAGISTCLDTTLNVPWENWEGLLPYIDLFLADLKCMDRALHLRYTGREGAHTLANLRRLSEQKKPVILRLPVVPGVNDTPEETAAREIFLRELTNLVRRDVFTVADHGAAKYRALQRENLFFEKKKGR